MSGDPFQKLAASEKAVERLTPFAATLYFETGRQVDEMDCSGGFVDMLSSWTGRTDKCFGEIAFNDAELSHPLDKEALLFCRDGKLNHCLFSHRFPGDDTTIRTKLQTTILRQTL